MADCVANVHNLFANAAVVAEGIFASIVVVGAGLWAARHVRQAVSGRSNVR